MDDVYLDNVNPSVQEVREWGYNEALYFIEQDEDLILHAPVYTTVLMELASDCNCPKNDYALSILSYYSQVIMARRVIDEITEVRQQVFGYVASLSDDVKRWKFDFLKLAEQIFNPMPLTEADADKIAWRLIVGNYCERDFQKRGFLKADVLGYKAFTTTYSEYLYVNLKIGRWKLSKLYELNELDDI